MKKLLIAAFALVLGALAVQAEELVSLGIYCQGEGSIEFVGKAPKGVYVGKKVENKDGTVSFPCYINLANIQSAEFEFKVTGDLRFFASLYAFSRPGHKIIPLQCDKFEYNGKPIRVPRVINGWRRILTRNVVDGSTFTIKLELSKPEN